MTSDKDWSLHYYRNGDEQGILDLLTAAFGRWPAVDISVPPIDHLRWKLTSDPIAREFQYLVDAGRIIGTRLLMSQQVLVKGRALNCTKFTDLTIDRDYQGRGIMRQLWTESETAARRRFKMSMVLTDSQLADFMKRRGHRRPANTLEHLKCDVSSPAATRRPAGFAITRAACFDARVDELFAQVATDFDLITVRSSAYLNWRYADPRAGRSVIYVAEMDVRMLGYVVVAPSRRRAFIADLLVLPGRADVLAALVEQAVAHCAANGLSSLRCWSVRHHPYRDVLLAACFAPVREEEGVTLLPYGDTDLDFVFEDERARLHIVPGDTDLI
jgi:GNAT superfamily N-acetyltransferase